MNEEHTRRLEELRAKYRKPPEPKPAREHVTLENIKECRSRELIGYQRRNDDFWRVAKCEVELKSGEIVLIWLVEEPWLPLRDEILNYCPHLDTPSDDYFQDIPLLG